MKQIRNNSSMRIMLLFCLIDVWCVTGTMCGCEHRFDILMDFFNATNGLWWTHNTGWGTIAPCGPSWHGVACTAVNEFDKDITYVSMMDNRLTGTLPPSWGNLTYLEDLVLHTNSLHGTLPESWSSMTRLRYPDLQANNLNGTLPASWGSLSNVELVQLQNNHFTGTLPASWGSLRKLDALYLRYNSISGGIPETWGSMNNLRKLYFESNKLNGTLPDSFNGLSKLEDLFLRDNSLMGGLPESWGQMPSLKTLALENNRISGTLPDSFGNLSNLVNLLLSNNSLSGTLPHAFSNMSANFLVLNIHSNRLSGTLPESWSRLRGVYSIALYANSLRGTLPVSWGSIPSLQKLYLQQNCLHGEVPSSYDNEVFPSAINMLNLCETNCTIAPTGVFSNLVSCQSQYQSWPAYCNSLDEKGRTATPSTEFDSASPTYSPSFTTSAASPTATCSLSVTASVDRSASYSESGPSHTITRNSTSTSLSTSKQNSSGTLSVLSYSVGMTRGRSSSTSLTATSPLSVTDRSSSQTTTGPSPSATLTSSTTPPALSVSHSQWMCGGPGDMLAVVAVAPVLQLSIPILPNAATAVIIRGGSEARSVAGNVSLAVEPADRLTLRSAYIIINISILEPLSAVRWAVRDIRFDGQQLNASDTTTNNVAWHLLTIRAPAGRDWIPADTSLLLDAHVRLHIVWTCDGGAVLSATVEVPVPGVAKELSGEVVVASRASQVASALAGGASSGSAVGRVMAIRSMVLCDADAAVGGGVLDLGLHDVCATPPEDNNQMHSSTAKQARSAVLSNFVLLIVVAGVLGSCCALWMYFCETTLAAAMRVLSLPSTLLPAWIVILPSTAGASTLLAARLSESACRFGDVALVLTGIMLCSAPPITLLVLWAVQCRGGDDAHNGASWVCEERRIDATSRTAKNASMLYQRLQVALRRGWKWHAAQQSLRAGEMRGEARSASSLDPRHAWVVLLEYRSIWFPALDSAALVTLAALTVAGGLGSTTLCRACTVLVVALVLALLIATAVSRPFTTLFAYVYALSTLTLTLFSIVAQMLFTFVSATDTSGLWLVRASAACDLAIVGVTAVRMIFDVVELICAVRRRVLRGAQREPTDAPPLQIFDVVADGTHNTDCDNNDAIPMLPFSEADADGAELLSPDEMRLLQDLENDFWDASGAAHERFMAADDDAADDILLRRVLPGDSSRGREF